MPYKDREKQLAAQRKHYTDNKQDYLDRQSQRRNKIRRYVVEYKTKNNICTDCKIQFPYYVLDFDHLPEFTKVSEVAKLMMSSSLETVIAEIEKCEIVCANCHRIRTFTRAKKYGSVAESG